jgi:uncharacterized protein (TIGR02598 family)
MRTSPRNLRRNQSGFTLVEVTLAIAVALIGIVAVLGLLPQGMQSARSAVDNTITATIAEGIFSQLRAGSFSQEEICRDPACSSQPAPPLKLDLNNQLTIQNGATLNYDQTGTITNVSASYYQAQLSSQPLGSGLAEVQVQLVWPAFNLANHAPPNTNIFSTLITWSDNP